MSERLRRYSEAASTRKAEATACLKSDPTSANRASISEMN